MIKEAIILAGGLGTRLRSAVPDLPKCMAPVNGKPFLSYLIDYFTSQGIQRFIFSLGYMHETIEDFLREKYPSLAYACSIENEPLGTGGAILKALSLSASENMLAANGDTFFRINISALSSFHEEHGADCTLSLKPMKDSDRYGVVETNNDQHIISFLEKKWYASSTINGGVYALNTSSFLSLSHPAKFSFEKDYLEKYYATQKMYGFIQDEYFIDIGIPEDFNKAQKELPIHL